MKITSNLGGSIAKIARPRILNIYPRSRLFALLDQYRDYPATWISAPAGSGKTILAASYLTEKKLPAIWYQMDEGDSDITTFFYYMGLAAAEAAPRFKTPLPLLTPEYLRGIETFTLRYFENLYSRLKPPFLIVLDNYQLVPNNSMFHQVICAGIDAVPDGIKIVCISREDPPARFARLRANERLKLMAAKEIGFTFEECQGMVRMKGFKNFHDETVQLMHERTGGWAAGLVLMMEGARARGLDSVRSDLATEMVFDYFAQELFKKTDQEMREFLVKSAYLPKMTASMAVDLTSMPDAEKKLNRLCRSNFFTYKDFRSEPSYEYHPLFREFLQSHAQEVITREQIAQNRTDAARILEEAGQVEDAVRLLISARDWESVTPMILAHAPAIVLQGRGNTLSEWLAAFPVELLDRSSWLLYWKGVSHLYYSDRDAYGCFEKAFQLFEPQGELTGTLLAWSGAVDSLFNLGEFTRFGPWIRWIDTQIDLGLVFPSDDIEARVVSSMAGALVWGFPRRDDVGVWLDRALSLSLDIGDAGLALKTFFYMKAYYYCIGDSKGMEMVARRMLGMIPDGEASPLSRIYYEYSHALAIAMNASPVGDKQEFQHVEEGLAIANKSGVHVLDDMLFVCGIMIAFDLGDLTTADQYFQKLAAGLDKKPYDIVFRHNGLYVWRLFLAGDVDQARAFLDSEQENRIVMAVRDFCNNLFLDQTLRAVLLLGQNHYGGALRHVQAARALIPKAGEGYYWVYLCNLVEACIAERTGRKHRTLECLGKAMEIARKRSYKTLYFFWQPHLLAHLCALALENGIEVEYVREMIRVFDLPPEESQFYSESWPWPIRIHTLGKFELYRDGDLVIFRGKTPKKPLQLLMAIISMGGEDVSKDQLEDLLWPDANGDKAQSVFKTTLLRLRSILGKDHAVLINQGRVSLNPQCCWVDAWAFEKLIDQVELTAHQGSKAKPFDATENIPYAEKAFDLYGGKYLAGEVENDWSLSFRDHLLARYCSLVLLVGTHLEKAGNLDQAAACYRHALDTDEIPDEEIYRRLIGHYNRKGQSWKAMETYVRLKRTFASKYGTKPSFKMDAGSQ